MSDSHALITCPLFLSTAWREPHPLFMQLRLMQLERAAVYLYDTGQIDATAWRAWRAWSAAEQARIQEVDADLTAAELLADVDLAP